jgi:hypothetical protein
MLCAILICSDPACAEELEALGHAPDDFDSMACRCGCTLQAIAFSEHREARIGPVAGVFEVRRAA